MHVQVAEENLLGLSDGEPLRRAELQAGTRLNHRRRDPRARDLARALVDSVQAQPRSGDVTADNQHQDDQQSDDGPT